MIGASEKMLGWRGGRSWLVVGVIALSGCGLRQNLRNEFVSYRGAWHCEQPRCGAAQMVRAIENHREGTVNVTHVEFKPRVIMAFYPGAPVATFTADISCGGARSEVPADKKAPGAHGLRAEPDSWIVVIAPADYEFANCKAYRVVTRATWPDGKTYHEAAGLQVR